MSKIRLVNKTSKEFKLIQERFKKGKHVEAKYTSDSDLTKSALEVMYNCSNCNFGGKLLNGKVVIGFDTDLIIGDEKLFKIKS